MSKSLSAICLTFLALVATTSAANPAICVGLNCPISAAKCVLDTTCKEILDCLTVCFENPADAQCPFACIMSEGHVGNQPFRDLLDCMVENSCLDKYEEDGRCLATVDQGLQDLTDVELVKGDWWVLKGQNCGQDEIWRGGYDWYPCQHQRFTKLDDGSWINNTTYCNGKDSQCTSDLIITIPVTTVLTPGVIRQDYPRTEAPLPQVEDWRFISYPDPDWAFVIWCGTTTVVDYSGAFVISRHRTLDGIPSHVEEEFRSATAKFGIDYDSMCVSNNSKCIE